MADGHDDASDLLHGVDAPRPLPPDVRDRLEAALGAPGEARPLGPELTDRLAGVLGRDPGSGHDKMGDSGVAVMFEGLGGSRSLPAGMADRLAAAFSADIRRRRSQRRLRVGVGVAAALLLVASVAGIALRSHTSAPVAQPDGSTAPAVSGAASAAGASSAASGTGTAGAAPVPAAAPAAGGPVTRTGGRGSVDAVIPSSGPASGGTTVTIYGVGLAGASAVLFGTAAATHVEVVSTGEIEAVSPAHAPGVVPVTVITGRGPVPAGPGVRFAYAAP